MIGGKAMPNPVKFILPAIFGILTLFAIIIFGAAYDTVSRDKQDYHLQS